MAHSGTAGAYHMTVITFPNGDKAPGDIPGDNIAKDEDNGIEKCLELATQRDLEEVFIIGRKKDGDVWFSTNDGDVGNMLFLLETAKAILIKECLGG
jgi:hypothetical protein